MDELNMHREIGTGREYEGAIDDCMACGPVLRRHIKAFVSQTSIPADLLNRAPKIDAEALGWVYEPCEPYRNEALDGLITVGHYYEKDMSRGGHMDEIRIRLKTDRGALITVSTSEASDEELLSSIERLARSEGNADGYSLNKESMALQDALRGEILRRMSSRIY